MPSGGFQPARSSEESFLYPAVHALQRIFYQQKKLFYNQLDVHPQFWTMKGVLKDQGNGAWRLWRQRAADSDTAQLGCGGRILGTLQSQ